MRGVCIYNRKCSGNPYSSCCWVQQCCKTQISGEAWGFAGGYAFPPMTLCFGRGILLCGSGRRWGYGVKTRVEGRGEIGYAQTITMGSKPQNIYLFQLNDSIKWTPVMLLAWITVLRGTHKWSAVTPSCSLMYQIQCLPRVQRLSQMLKLFVLVNKLNFTVTLYFYYAAHILREVVVASVGSQCYTEAYRRPREHVAPAAHHSVQGAAWAPEIFICSQGAWPLGRLASPRETCLGARVSGVSSGSESWP